MTYKNLQVITLKDKSIELNILPQIGGRISSFIFDDFHILRPLSLDSINSGNSLKGGCFPLVPFSNRIKNAKFNFNGLKLQLNQNDFPHAIHGHGYLKKWTVSEQTKSSLTIIYHHQENDFGWPWSYEITQSIYLKNSSCIIKLILKNTSNSNMPFGFGIHPFFNFNDQIILKFGASREWVGPPENFPIKTKPVENSFDMIDGSLLWKRAKTASYKDFEGEAAIIWPFHKKKILIRADNIFNHLIVHVPNGAEYFCLEPVSHPTDGFNLSDQKIENIDNNFLLPNGSITGSIEIDLCKYV